MQGQDNLKQEIGFPGLLLGVYREIAAHLRQVEGVEAGLRSQTSSEFDYNQSQIEGLWIQYTQTASLESRQRVEQILGYYRSRYNA